MSSPPRLRNQDTEVGQILRSLGGPPPARSEPSYASLQRLRLRRTRRTVGAALVAGAVVVAGAVLVLPGPRLIRPEGQVAELALPALDSEGAPSPATTPGVLGARPEPEETTAPGRAPNGRRPLAADLLPRETTRGVQNPTEPPEAGDPSKGQGALVASPSDSGVVQTLTQCAEYARNGAIDAASGCYAHLAEGTGTAAELASLEQVRLWGRARGDSARAEQLLQAHLRRFPKGALQHEARVMRVNLLAQQGRNAELLSEVDTILSAGLVPERRAELTKLRALTLAELGRCEEALGSLEGPPHAAEAGDSALERVRKLCPAP